MKVFSKLISDVLDLIYPKRLKCLFCKAPLKNYDHLEICTYCKSMGVYIQGELCKLCGRPLLGDEGRDGRCGECRGEKIYFDGAASVFEYEGLIKAVIHRLKYEWDVDAAIPLGRYMADRLHKLNWPVDIILPVPLHGERMKERGFNQSCLIGREVARECSIDIAQDILIRKRYTESQVHLSKKERVANVNGAFDIVGGDRVNNRSILIIDDIMTTGATLNECSRIVKNCGAERVYCLTAACPIHFK